MCGTALSPASTIACAASIPLPVVSLPRYVRLTAVPAGIDLDAVSSDSVSFAVISREKFFSSSREPMVCSVIVSVLPVVLTSKGRIRGRLDHGLHGDLAVLLHSRLRRDRVFAPQHLYFGAGNSKFLIDAGQRDERLFVRDVPGIVGHAHGRAIHLHGIDLEESVASFRELDVLGGVSFFVEGLLG